MAKIAFFFPGQGAQYVGMGKSLYESCAAAREIYDICNDKKIMEISFNGKKEDMLPTKIAQRAIFMADLAAVMVLKKRGIVADGAAGFSLGEIPALAFAGLMGVKQAYDFVCFRADVMHECAANQQGSMMVVLRLSAEAVESACAKVDGAYPANYNAPGQVVVAYKIEVENALKEAIYAVKGKVLPLPVSGAFHSPLMDKAAAKLEAYLTETKLTNPTIPIYSNVTGKKYGTPDEALKLLAQQVNSPVRWQATIENMIAAGYDTFIEAGPGKALTGMVKKIDKSVRTFNVFDEETLERCVSNI